VKALDDVLPLASRAVQVTVVSPSGNDAPEAGTHETDGLASAMSVAVAVQVTTAPLGDVASATTLDGTVSVGAVVSRTVMRSVAWDEFPASSVAVHVTVVSPRANTDALGGTHVTVTSLSTRSDAAGVV
jgi:hypothetical protein